jgi:hypothetical protein
MDLGWKASIWKSAVVFGKSLRRIPYSCRCQFLTMTTPFRSAESRISDTH